MPRQEPSSGAGGTSAGGRSGSGSGGAVGSVGGAGAGGGGIVDGPLPSIASLRIGAPDADGAVELRVTVASGRAAGVQAAVALSRRGGDLRPATMDASGSATVAGDDAATLVVRWRALDDLGFRPDPTAVLWMALDDGRGAGPAATFPVPPFSNRRAAARRVDHYMANYGSWSPEEIAEASKYQLVIAHPGQGRLMRADVAAMQQGPDPADTRDDVLVLCYISVGEDLRTAYMPDAQLRTDPRFKGDGSGPRIDPRGWNADGMPLTGIDPLGLPSTGGTGFASYYLDDNDVHNSAAHAGDGLPDRNKIFGALFVNAGDPAWFKALDGMTLDGTDRLAGFRELLTPDFGRGLDCDGVFLDTIDTAAPNSYTNAASANQSEFEWTAPGYGAFMRRLRDAYPDRVVLQNRGLFFFDPRRPQYRFNARGAIDLLLFESFRLNSNTSEDFNPVHYADNRYNFAPKLMAEANRPDGFRVLSLGYAEGPASSMSEQTLLGASTVGLESLLEDIHVTQELTGFRHYLTDGAVALVNEFVLAHANLEDHTPPQWTSTYNDHFVSPAVAATPRVGIQQAVAAGGGKLTVRWDVALDMTRVHYTLYAQEAPFDFAADPALARSHRVPLAATAVPAGYLDGVGVGRFPYEATVAGFTPGKAQYLVIRAADSAEPANEETNQTVLTVTP